MGIEFAADGTVIYVDDDVSDTQVQLDLTKEARSHLRLAADKLLKLEYVSQAVTSLERTLINRTIDKLSTSIHSLELELKRELED